MKILLYITSISTLSLAPLLVLAQESRLTFIEQMPFIDRAVNSTEDYVSVLYLMAISLASILVVLRLIQAGVKYMLSEIVTDKGKAKEDIKGALLGLLIILGAVTILNTINPELTKTDIFRNADVITPSAVGSNASTSPVQQSSGGCPQGKVWKECEKDGEFSGGCYAPNDVSWCTGTLIK